MQTADEGTLAQAQFNRYTRARDGGHLPYVETSKKCNKYYWGDQWAAADVAKLDDEGRPYLTINEILPTVNTILGEQSRTRADVQFKPRGRGALTEVANALNMVYLQVTDNNMMEWTESEVFADGVIGGRGYYDIRLDFSDSISGEIRITAEDPHDIIIDPDAKSYDPKDWKEVYKTRWLSVDDIEELYGKEQANKIRFVADDFDTLGVDSMTFQDSFATHNEGGYSPTDTLSDEEDRKSIRKVRVIERQYRKMRKVRSFVDNTTGDMRTIPDSIDAKKAKEMAAQLNMSIISRMQSSIRWTVTADKFVLFDNWSPYEHFTIVPFFAYFRRGRPFGVVENLISPQDNLNKVASQELHVVNTTANSGWTFESGSLVGMTRDDLERDGAKTGLVLEHARNSNPPAKILPNQIPTGLDRVSMKAAQFVRDISGISESMLGYDGAEVSGVAIEKKQARGVTQLQVLLDNLTRTRRILAERILNLVQRFYTEERIIRITQYDRPGSPQGEMVVNEATPEGFILNDLTMGEYDVAISSAPARDTFDDSQFAEAIALRTAGIMIPDDTVIEYSSLAHKYEVAERVRKMTGTNEPTEEELQQQQLMAEIQMQQVQLQMQELAAKIKDLTSKAALNQAKADEITGDAEGERLGIEQRFAGEQQDKQLQVERENLQNQYDMKAAQLQTMLVIAKMQKETQEKANAMKAASDRAKAKETLGGKSRKGLSDVSSKRKAK